MHGLISYGTMRKLQHGESGNTILLEQMSGLTMDILQMHNYPPFFVALFLCSHNPNEK